MDQHQKASEIIGELRANNNYISDSLDEIMHDENIIVTDYDKILERLQTFLINKTTLNETDRNKIQKLLNDSTISPRKIFTHILNYNEALNVSIYQSDQTEFLNQSKLIRFVPSTGDCKRRKLWTSILLIFSE